MGTGTTVKLGRLAPFAHDWVGGDARALQALAGKLTGYVPAIAEVTAALNKQADGLTAAGPGAWTGSAATAFTTAWQRDALTTAALGAVIDQVAQIVSALAVALSQIENALETEATAASAHGVQILPGGQPGPAPFGPPSSSTQAAQEQWVAAYQQTWQQAQAAAGNAREQAAAQLTAVYQQIAPPAARGSGITTTSDASTLTDLLADLWAVPTGQRREVNETIEKLEGKLGSLEGKIAKAAKADAPTGKLSDELRSAQSELDKANQELTRTGQGENALTKLLDSRVGNVQDYLAGRAGPGEHVNGRTPGELATAAEDDPSALAKLLDAGEAIPVVDMVAAIAGTAFGAQEDVQQGKPVTESIVKESIANITGLAAGAVVGGAIGGIPGVLIGGVVGYGVGDLTHNLLWEPWGQDEAAYGAIPGVLYGIGHSEFATFDDTKALAVSVGHTAEHLWDKVF